MPAGRPPKPTALKALAGNPGKRALPKADAQLAPRLPPPPRHLNDEAKREWRRVGKQLLALRLVTVLDVAALTAYCQAWALYVMAVGELEEHGAIAYSPNGYPMLSPWFTQVKALQEMMLRALREFGLSPSSRAKVTAAAPPEAVEDPASAWMRGATA